MKQSNHEHHGNESEDENELEAEQPDFAVDDVCVENVGYSVWGDDWRSTDFHTKDKIDAIKRAQAEDGGWIGNLICNLRDDYDGRNQRREKQPSRKQPSRKPIKSLEKLSRNSIKIKSHPRKTRTLTSPGVSSRKSLGNQKREQKPQTQTLHVEKQCLYPERRKYM